MRTVVVFAIAGALGAAIQTALPHRIPFLPAAPDLILVLVVYLGLHFHSAGGALGAFLLGYLLDTSAGIAPGLSCLTMTLVFGVVYLLSRRLWMENPVSNVAAVALGEGLKVVTVLLFFAVGVPGGVPWLSLARTLGFEALFAVLLTPFIFSALDAQLGRPRAARAREAD
ncbi:MAG TPA: rod shape-determining protein MreD [Candidatus Binatia bacterium]|nr:rod shape-determining protein MreD [Candidatus Binatia bacterium]